MARPEKFEDITSENRHGEVIASIQMGNLLKAPYSVSSLLLQAISKAQEEGLDFSEDYTRAYIYEALTDEVKEKKLKEEQDRWDRLKAEYDKFSISPEECEQYHRYTINRWAEENDYAPISWPKDESADA